MKLGKLCKEPVWTQFAVQSFLACQDNSVLNKDLRWTNGEKTNLPIAPTRFKEKDEHWEKEDKRDIESSCFARRSRCNDPSMIIANSPVSCIFTSLSSETAQENILWLAYKSAPLFITNRTWLGNQQWQWWKNYLWGAWQLSHCKCFFFASSNASARFATIFLVGAEYPVSVISLQAWHWVTAFQKCLEGHFKCDKMVCNKIGKCKNLMGFVEKAPEEGELLC